MLNAAGNDWKCVSFFALSCFLYSEIYFASTLELRWMSLVIEIREFIAIGLYFIKFPGCFFFNALSIFKFLILSHLLDQSNQNLASRIWILQVSYLCCGWCIACVCSVYCSVHGQLFWMVSHLQVGSLSLSVPCLLYRKVACKLQCPSCPVSSVSLRSTSIVHDFMFVTGCLCLLAISMKNWWASCLDALMSDAFLLFYNPVFFHCTAVVICRTALKFCSFLLKENQSAWVSVLEVFGSMCKAF